MKNVAILGSTGSIGCSTLDVIHRLGGDYRVHSLAARSQLQLLAEQVKMFAPQRIAVPDESAKEEIRSYLSGNSVMIQMGNEALVELVKDPEVDIVVNALVGSIGLKATLAALEADKIVALANKESIVMAGHLVMELVAEKEGLLIPIDSEHSAILQCLRGEDPEGIKRLILTASGGPFLRTPIEYFPEITPDEALCHPNWNMGPKITTDSATMMNKGLEVIEAHYLFNLPPEKINVVIHPQSVVHSLVEFVDGSIKAQLCQPDMRVPIQYAITYPKRIAADFVVNDLVQVGSLDFEMPDFQRFPCLNLAYEALKKGIGYPTVLNAANEVAVQSFLNHSLHFHCIPILIRDALEAFDPPLTSDLDSILKIDRWTRQWCEEKIKEMISN